MHSLRAGLTWGLLLLATLAAGCGSDSSTGGTTKSKRQKDGRIFTRNDSQLILEVTVNDGRSAHKTRVEPGERKEVSQDILKGGTKIAVLMDVVGGAPGTVVGFVQNDPVALNIVVDGTVTIVATAANFIGDQWRADYEVQGS